MEHLGIFFCFVGPAGGGKTTLVKTVLEKNPETCLFSISATTRTPRSNEKNGVDYHFHTRQEFQSLIDSNKLFEYEEVHGNYYGTPNAPIDKCLNNEIDLVLDIDIHGALDFKKAFPDRTIIIFTMPPSLELMIERLKLRGTDPADMQKRLATAQKEIALFAENKDLIDYLLVNRDLELSKIKAIAILATERLRLKRFKTEDVLKLCQFD